MPLAGMGGECMEGLVSGNERWQDSGLVLSENK